MGDHDTACGDDHDDEQQQDGDDQGGLEDAAATFVACGTAHGWVTLSVGMLTLREILGSRPSRGDSTVPVMVQVVTV